MRDFYERFYLAVNHSQAHAHFCEHAPLAVTSVNMALPTWRNLLRYLRRSSLNWRIICSILAVAMA